MRSSSCAWEGGASTQRGQAGERVKGEGKWSERGGRAQQDNEHHHRAPITTHLLGLGLANGLDQVKKVPGQVRASHGCGSTGLAAGTGERRGSSAGTSHTTRQGGRGPAARYQWVKQQECTLPKERCWFAKVPPPNRGTEAVRPHFDSAPFEATEPLVPLAPLALLPQYGACLCSDWQGHSRERPGPGAPGPVCPGEAHFQGAL